MLAVRGAGAALRRAWLHGLGPRRGSRANGGTGAGGDAWPVRGGAALGRPQHVVDLRSDTVTQPSEAMRRAMAQAAVGDDDYGEDPTVNELQHLAAKLLGMEDALFVPTATMANLIAVMCHCQRRGAQLLLGAGAHLHVYEHGGVAQVAGVHSQALQDLPDGTLDLEQLELAVREAHGSRYHPRPELICLENTHSSAGGRALPLAHLQQVHQLAERYGLRVHMDGARLLNAAVAQAVEPAQITQHCDSVSLCFSKVSWGREGAPGAGREQLKLGLCPPSGHRAGAVSQLTAGAGQRSGHPPGPPGPGCPSWGRAGRPPGVCGGGLARAEDAGRRDAAGRGAGSRCPHRAGAGRGNAAQRPQQRPALRSRHPGAAVTSVLRQPPGRGDEHGDGGGAGGVAVPSRALRIHAGSERGGAG
uniref:Aromatic amino acid beta-eliminating lyase/threonine aldolase domain-containing protein n=1 Tax=Anas zonorhyncha TaxID=75864 RepID=A0A8B9VI44_9AVES